MYSDVSLFIDGEWIKAAGGRTIPVVNPATSEAIGTVAHADRSDLDRALEEPRAVLALAFLRQNLAVFTDHAGVVGSHQHELGEQVTRVIELACGAQRLGAVNSVFEI